MDPKQIIIIHHLKLHVAAKHSGMHVPPVLPITFITIDKIMLLKYSTWTRTNEIPKSLFELILNVASYPNQLPSQGRSSEIQIGEHWKAHPKHSIEV